MAAERTKMPHIITRCLLQIAAVFAWNVVSGLIEVTKLANITSNLDRAGIPHELFLPSPSSVFAWLVIILAGLGIAAWGVHERRSWAPWLILMPMFLIAIGLASKFAVIDLIQLACLGNAFYELITDSDAIVWLKGSTPEPE